MTLPARSWAFRQLGGTPAGTLSCGFLTKSRGWDSRDSRRPSFSAVVCLSGAALYDGRHAIAPGDVFFRFVGVPHSIEITAAPWHECWISLGAPLEDLLVATGLVDRRMPVRRGAADAAWLAALAASVAPLAAAPDTALPQHLLHLQGLLLAVLRQPAESGLDLDLACRLLADPLLPLEDVAQRCGLGYDPFRREFRRRTGLAPGTWRSHQLLERARHELLLTDKSIQDIAADLGYANPFAFSAAFRRATGVSPRACRQGR
jgi:AraC-like DNA-binding protein